VEGDDQLVPSQDAGFAPNLAVTGVGSLPHLSVERGVADVLAHCPEYPYWPQFPRLSGREDMYRQFSAGLPGLVEDAGGGGQGRRLKWRRDEATLAALERVYQASVALDQVGSPAQEGEALSGWGTSPRDARGLHALREALGGSGRSGERGAALRCVKGVKGQITGPVSLGLAVSGPGDRALLYEEDLMDGVVRGIALRAAWQGRFLAEAVRVPGGRFRPPAAEGAKVNSGSSCRLTSPTSAPSGRPTSPTARRRWPPTSRRSARPSPGWGPGGESTVVPIPTGSS